MMPHMDGYEMMKTLKENTSLQSVIVVNSNIE
jgi:CheY-like chemotaxis protein